MNQKKLTKLIEDSYNSLGIKTKTISGGYYNG